MQYGYSDSKPQLARRLKRIEGQVRGVGRMIDDDMYCIDILTQISAAQAALDKVALELLRQHTRHCLTGSMPASQQADKTDELVAAVGRLLGR